eukprot:2864347-Rhodomonas_salina.1
MNRIPGPVISIGQLRKFKVPDPDTGPLSIPQPQPVSEDQSGQYFAVEHIVAEQTGWSHRRNVKRYAIRWKGYGPESDSWLTHEAMARGCPEATAHSRGGSSAVDPRDARGGSRRQALRFGHAGSATCSRG